MITLEKYISATGMKSLHYTYRFRFKPSTYVSAQKIIAKLQFDSDPFNGKRPNNVEVVPGVVSVEGNRFTLQDNTTLVADSFIFCTGYLLKFPFLDKSSGIVVEGKKIRPLFRDSLNVEHPSMIFIGLPTNTYQAGLYYDQVC